MGKKIELTGLRFGRLTVIKEDEPYYTSGGNRKVRWICRCDCGNELSVVGERLRNGNTMSCGCYQVYRAREANSKNLIGKKFGRLVVVGKADDYKNEKYSKSCWICKCICGKETIVRGNSLISGKTKSCGCLKSEANSIVHRKHGMSETRLNNILYGMKQRCYNRNSQRYSDYGGRGITVCPEWLGEHGLENFAKWALENGYADNLSIDRIDNDKGYSPDNCKWSTSKEQANNKRDTKKYKYNGEFHTLSEWADIIGLNYHMLKARVRNYGYTIKEAIETPKYTRFSKLKNRNKND